MKLCTVVKESTMIIFFNAGCMMEVVDVGVYFEARE